MGFGGSFTEASSTVFDKMTEGKKDELLRAYFDRESGLGYELGRIPMGSCDFGLGNWTCGDLADGDMSLGGFSIARYHDSILNLYKRAQGVKGFSIARYHDSILNLYKRAQGVKGSPFTLLASPWSPPPWMKTASSSGERRFDGDGHLRPECGAAWARHFAKFVEALKQEGINVWGVTVQNEPEAAQIWESCIYTAEEERDFVRDHLGPALERHGVKILVWDHNRDGMLERAHVAYADPEAAKYIWGLGYHWYGDCRFEKWPPRTEIPYEDRNKGHAPIFELRARAGFENVRAVAELRPDKHILFTEGCQELGDIPLADVLGKWKYGERYGMNIIRDLNSGTEGWIDWNLYLDETGGPNHVGNLCVAPIICDTRTDQVLYQPAYWYLGHFSRYIRPGAVRVLSSTSRDVLEVVAFSNPDGSLAVVVLNQSDEDLGFWLKVAGSGSVFTDALPRSITTFLLDESEAAADVRILRFKGPIQTSHAQPMYVKVTDGSWKEGALVQTSEDRSGWETFDGFLHYGPRGELVCRFRTFHRTWVSVTRYGEVTAVANAEDCDQIQIVPQGDGKYALKALWGEFYLSAAPGSGQKLVTTGAVAGPSELFVIRNLPV